MVNSRAQASVEFLLVFATALLILTAIVLVTNEKVTSISSMKEQNDARNAVFDISSAAQDVYAQGDGARKQVLVDLPSSYEPSESYVSGNAIKLRARGTDYATIEDFGVYGSLPSNSGKHWVWISSEGDKVRIGAGMIKLSQNSVYLIMKRNTTIGDTVTVESIWDKDINVTQTVVWDNPDVPLVIMGGGTHSLSPGDTYDTTMTFLSKENSIGYYNGKIVFFATDGTVNETFELPITVEVIAFVFAPPLTVNPELWNESVQAGDTVSQEFMVCTNIYTALSSVEFIPSALPPGTWVWDTTPLSAMGRGTCRPKVLKITVPGGTEPGKYTGSIQVVGQGSDKAKDTISVSILVGGDPGDSIGPNVTDVTHSPSKLYTMEPVNFLITASDKNRGNNTIKGCEFRANGGNWTVMEAVDGDFNSMTEFAKISHSGFSTLGDHNVSFRCTDYRDNVGPVRNYTVSTMKNFLFVIKGTTPSSSEQTWLTWMDTHDSLQGFGWDYDINTDNNVSAGSVNLSYYSAVLMSDYTAPSGIGAPLQTYRNNGGRVLLIGSALDQGPRDLGLTSEPGTQGSNLGILVITFLHYVTQEYDANETVIIYIGSGGSRAVKDSFIGEWLAVDDSNHNAIMLGEHAGYLLWGPKTADVLNNEGYRITANCLDYSVLQSTIMPG